MKECRNCKYSEIIRIGRLDVDIPDCTLDIPEWIKCRNNNYSRYEEREEQDNE